MITGLSIMLESLHTWLRRVRMQPFFEKMDTSLP